MSSFWIWSPSLSRASAIWSAPRRTCKLQRASGRTGVRGEYVGGGALLGSIIGAVAGGGKGALIGRVAGAAAGAGGEVLTRGQSVRVPRDTLLTFRLERPVELGVGRAHQGFRH